MAGQLITLFPGGAMRTYVMPLNVIVFLGTFWTSVIYGVSTRNWAGALLWLALGFAALTSERLTPPRIEEQDER